MSSDLCQSKFPAEQLNVNELKDESDFEAILSSDGYISISGYGSLLSERSARSTFPDLINFRVARLTGFRRIFASVGRIFFAHGIANLKTEEIGGLSVEPCEGETIVVTVFEIKKSEIPAFIERESVYRFLAVFPETLDGKPFSSPAKARRFISKNMENIRYIRFGEMMSYLAVFIFVIVSWLQEALVMQLTTTSWIIHSLVTGKQPSASTLKKWVQAS
ncbi:Butirosin biosynthesis [Quillaja saponaria]|uniref:Butirosin biosynthesis n=1 Tax=Quillaja saponaria TaxID=32244 RepID=A0AAD7QF32_QUISA|nr:Butirosin biosynthesis [Quillaja saponaria]